jgi:hypothetical protein
LLLLLALLLLLLFGPLPLIPQLGMHLALHLDLQRLHLRVWGGPGLVKEPLYNQDLHEIDKELLGNQEL